MNKKIHCTIDLQIIFVCMYCMYICFCLSLSLPFVSFMFLHPLTSDTSASSFGSYDAKICHHSVASGVGGRGSQVAELCESPASMHVGVMCLSSVVVNFTHNQT